MQLNCNPGFTCCHIPLILSPFAQVRALRTRQTPLQENVTPADARLAVPLVMRQTSVIGAFGLFKKKTKQFFSRRKYQETECGMLGPAIKLFPGAPDLNFCLAQCAGRV